MSDTDSMANSSNQAVSDADSMAEPSNDSVSDTDSMAEPSNDSVTNSKVGNGGGSGSSHKSDNRSEGLEMEIRSCEGEEGVWV